MEKKTLEMRNDENIKNYIDKVVHVKYDRVYSEMPDTTAVILYGISDDGYKTSAGTFEDIWLTAFPMDANNYNCVLLSHEDVDLLPTIWLDKKCVFIDKIKNVDPLYDDEAVLSKLKDLYIDQPDVMNIFGSEFGVYYPYIVLL